MSNNPTPIEVQKFLNGIDYPASKSALVDKAKDSGADGNVLEALENLPDQEFDSPTAVSSAVSG